MQSELPISMKIENPYRTKFPGLPTQQKRDGFDEGVAALGQVVAAELEGLVEAIVEVPAAGRGEYVCIPLGDFERFKKECHQSGLEG